MSQNFSPLRRSRNRNKHREQSVEIISVQNMSKQFIKDIHPGLVRPISIYQAPTKYIKEFEEDLEECIKEKADLLPEIKNVQ